MIVAKPGSSNRERVVAWRHGRKSVHARLVGRCRLAGDERRPRQAHGHARHHRLRAVGDGAVYGTCRRRNGLSRSGRDHSPHRDAEDRTGGGELPQPTAAAGEGENHTNSPSILADGRANDHGRLRSRHAWRELRCTSPPKVEGRPTTWKRIARRPTTWRPPIFLTSSSTALLPGAVIRWVSRHPTNLVS